MHGLSPKTTKAIVALLAEGVDRNAATLAVTAATGVALLAEGVDRNNTEPTASREPYVALLAEGVDRNIDGASSMMPRVRRPPRRGRG